MTHGNHPRFGRLAALGLAVALAVAGPAPVVASVASVANVTEVVNISPEASAGLRLAAPFGDGMVLPMNREVPIRGTAPSRARILVVGDWAPDRAARGQADDAGEWTVVLPTGPAGGPHAITVTAAIGEQRWTERLEDVLLGEVWLAGGQSNMQMTVAPGGGLQGVRDWPDEVARADAPRVRMLHVPRGWSWLPADRLADAATWTPVTPETAGSMSAVAWFFAERLHRERGVPVGIVHASYGGTRIGAWMSEATAARQPSLAEWLVPVRAEREAPGSMQRWRTERAAAATRAVRDRDPGFRDDWMAAATDDRGWPRVTVGAHWSEAPLVGHDGYVWMRRAVEVPAAMVTAAGDTPWTLELGAVDDRDVTWVNGTLVGRTEEDGRWNQPRRYVVPAGVVRAGRNVIAVRVHDTSGPGGMIGPADAMRLRPGTAEDGDAGVSIAGDWRFQPTLPQAELTAGGAATGPPPVRAERNLPTVLFNAMLAPLASFPVDGAIFYQGESNVGDPAYGTLLPALIDDWRRHFRGDAEADMPFLIVQIAPYGYRGDTDRAAWLRERQRRTAAAMPNVELVVTTDLGARHDIHPIDKRPVGERLAGLAIALADADADASSRARSPAPASIRFADGAAVVAFADTGGGLVVRGDGPPTHWQLRATDGRWRTARATVTADGRAVRVSSPRVPEPVAVRFGWGSSPSPNLFGGHGLPVVPFTSVAAPPGG